MRCSLPPSVRIRQSTKRIARVAAFLAAHTARRPRETRNLLEHLLRIHGFGEVRVVAGLQAALAIVFTRECRQSERGHPSRSFLRLVDTNVPHELVAVFARQADVTDDDIRALAREGLAGCPHGIDSQHVGATALEKTSRGITNLCFILDE